MTFIPFRSQEAMVEFEVMSQILVELQGGSAVTHKLANDRFKTLLIYRDF